MDGFDFVSYFEDIVAVEDGDQSSLSIWAPEVPDYPSSASAFWPDSLGENSFSFVPPSCSDDSFPQFPSLDRSDCSDFFGSDSMNTSSYLSSEQNVSFRCSTTRCGFETSTWEEIVDHRRNAHGQSTLGQQHCWCQVCGVVFGRKQDRQRHVSQSHSDKAEITRFYCPDCLRSSPFKRKDHYIGHRRKVHNESKGTVTPYLLDPPPGYVGRSSVSKPFAKKNNSLCIRFAPGSAGFEPETPPPPPPPPPGLDMDMSSDEDSWSGFSDDIDVSCGEYSDLFTCEFFTCEI
jgi:uncharacterized C2H2 Zn-finger protein